MRKHIDTSAVNLLGGAAAVLLVLACAPPSPVVTKIVIPPPADTIAIPLDALGANTYRGLEGGLYPGGANVPPADYHVIGLAHANAVRPLAVNGIPTADGKYVLMSIGGTGATATWCSASSAPPCDGRTFTGRAVSDPSVNHTALVIVNGAIPGSDIGKWSSATDSNYNRIRDTRLAPLGLSENQVQAVWMAVTDSATNFPSAAEPADAASQLRNLGLTIRSLKSRYPNLQLIFISTRPYGGYSPTGEPAAYESGFVIKWVIESRIAEARGQPGNHDFGYPGGASMLAPWISWAPYLWTRSWPRTEFDSSGAGLSHSGQSRMAVSLLDFFKSSPYTRCWFIVAATCG